MREVNPTSDKELEVPVISDFWIIPLKANCMYSDLLFLYLDNLCRLGLLKINYNPLIYIQSDYSELKNRNSIFISTLKKNSNIKVMGFNTGYGEVKITDFDIQFCEACI
ncbi:DUF4393 domain-containing protein [Bacillus mycoides]|uniref:Abi-alpha family protein n=1 Tax=Bacillus mycoides TaxID=1405 RepID=UPI001C00E867|nr:Abi-alpha family protein [Bacillus mycoides]QWG56872.1 DUF4393 domain-containing protein [Bacillus mycoides]QWG75350.1 DUF4393 domain-containing protein [Bacillus mycoides]QWH23880.1 DUF4393 domain-containing protein [Bacillus mycoides]